MKRVVVTGAASGIGAALVASYAALGCEAVGVDRDERLGAEVTEKIRVETGVTPGFLYGDLADPGDLNRLARALASQKIDVFVHSAGINATGAFEHADVGAQRAVLDVNLRAPLQLTRALLASKVLTRGSSVVFVSSLSHFVSYPGAAVYAASKDGLTAYARSLGVALAPQGIHVLTVFPGPTRTPHAARHSPDNRREHKRMPPEVLAAGVVRAVEQKRRRYVPGASNRAFAALGRWLPGLLERVMVRTLFEKMEARDDPSN